MKNFLSIPLLFVIFFVTDCQIKEEVLKRPIIVVTPPIKEFSLSGIADATISNFTFQNGDSQNQIIMVLPESYSADDITPFINLSDEVASISPKSGEKVFFEGKPAIEYTLTKKDGKTEKYFLYVQRSGELKAELLTKEITIDPFEYNVLKVRLTNVGTLGVPNFPNGVMGFQVEPFYTGTKNSFEYYNRIGFEPNSNVFSAEFYTKKTGKVSLKLTTNYPQRRETTTLDLSLVRGEKVFVSLLSSLETRESSNIMGMNFDPKKEYKATLTNDFISTTYEYPLKYVDDNNLKIDLPEKLDNTGYTLKIVENNILAYSSEVAVKGNLGNLVAFQTILKKSSTYQEYYPEAFTLNEKISFKHGDSFVGFERQFSTLEGDLKLVNLNTKNSYELKGSYVACCDGAVSFRKFIIPETLPVGDYEVYGILKGETSARYSRKVEIIK